MFDKIIIIGCLIVFALLLAVLIWWLACGRRHFIEHRCHKSDDSKESNDNKS